MDEDITGVGSIKKVMSERCLRISSLKSLRERERERERREECVIHLLIGNCFIDLIDFNESLMLY